MFFRRGRRDADFGGSGFQSMSISEVRVCAGWGYLVMLTIVGRCMASFVSLPGVFAWQRKGIEVGAGCGKTQLSHTMSVIAQVSLGVFVMLGLSLPSPAAEGTGPTSSVEMPCIDNVGNGRSCRESCVYRYHIHLT